jgi:outer membrane protein OmpA-like peptidoglycan-associated protein
MAKNNKNEWKVDSLDFSKLLQSYVKSTDADKFYYSPIVKSPTGGDSLVVYFEYDKSELNARGIRQMEIVADLLKSDPARKMHLSGYTDAKGTEDYNVQLSKKRAEAVKRKLAELGVNSAQIETLGRGADAPLDPNKKLDGTDNPEGRSRNRRTEIYLDF